MLKVYTAQYSYEGPNRTDITVKTAKPPWDIFAPTWDMVKEYLANPGPYQEKVYIAKYEAMVANAYVANRDALITLLHSSEVRVLVCFCKAGAFCHRVLLAKHLEALGAEYLGEILTK